jgi:hypothetical protein
VRSRNLYGRTEDELGWTCNKSEMWIAYNDCGVIPFPLFLGRGEAALGSQANTLFQPWK